MGDTHVHASASLRPLRCVFSPCLRVAGLCWKCQKRGHLSRECPYGAGGLEPWESGAAGPPLCMRCGRGECPAAGQRDYFRAEGGCTMPYLRGDLERARCYVCGARGHLCCAPAPAEPTRPSCYNCGAGGHTAAECARDTPHVIRSERSGRGGGGGGEDYGYERGYATPHSGGYERGGGGGRYSGGGSGGRYQSY